MPRHRRPLGCTHAHALSTQQLFDRDRPREQRTQKHDSANAYFAVRHQHTHHSSPSCSASSTSVTSVRIKTSVSHRHSHHLHWHERDSSPLQCSSARARAVLCSHTGRRCCCCCYCEPLRVGTTTLRLCADKARRRLGRHARAVKTRRRTRWPIDQMSRTSRTRRRSTKAQKHKWLSSVTRAVAKVAVCVYQGRHRIVRVQMQRKRWSGQIHPSTHSAHTERPTANTGTRRSTPNAGAHHATTLGAGTRDSIAGTDAYVQRRQSAPYAVVMRRSSVSRSTQTHYGVS